MLLIHHSFVFLSAFSVVLVLKFEAVHRLEGQVKDVLFSFYELLTLLFSFFLKFPAAIEAVLHELFDINIAREIQPVGLKLHDLCGTMQYNLLILVPVQRFCVLDLPTLLDHYLVEFKLNGLALNHLFFNCLFANKTIDVYIPFLADTMSTVHCLEVNLRVEV